jgi:hypothetical protein
MLRFLEDLPILDDEPSPAFAFDDEADDEGTTAARRFWNSAVYARGVMWNVRQNPLRLQLIRVHDVVMCKRESEHAIEVLCRHSSLSPSLLFSSLLFSSLLSSSPLLLFDIFHQSTSFICNLTKSFVTRKLN